MCSTELHRQFEVSTHAHAEIGQPMIRRQLGQELRERLAVIRLDLHQPVLARLVVLVVRQRMVWLGHTQLGEGARAQLLADHEADDPRGHE